MNLTAQREKIRALSTGPARRWYDIANGNATQATIRLYDEVSWLGISAEDFAADLATITAPTIEVQINSPGGNVFDGIAIYNALRAHPAHIITRVDGLAASIASVIAQAGDERIMMPAAQMMVHNAWTACVGNTKDMADMAKLLAQQDEVIVGIYADRSRKPHAHLRKLMDSETWFTAHQAVEEGLADEVHTAKGNTPTNRFDPALSLALLNI